MGDRVQRRRRHGGAFQFSLDFEFVTKIFERLKQFVGALVPLRSIFAQRFANDLLELSRRVPDITRERRRFFLKNRRHYLFWCVASE